MALGLCDSALEACLQVFSAATEVVDEILGQVMAATTRQLNASSSALFIRDQESHFLSLECVFQHSRILSPAEVNYPENLRSYRLTKRTLKLAQQPAVLVQLSRDHTSIEEAHRSYLLGLGVKTMLLIPLIFGKRLVGCLNFRFVEERDLRPEKHPFVLDQAGLIGAMEMLVDRSNIPGRLRCIFSVNDPRANDLPPETQHHILRIAQEAISNAVRHGNPANISVTLRCDRTHVELRAENDGPNGEQLQPVGQPTSDPALL